MVVIAKSASLTSLVAGSDASWIRMRPWVVAAPGAVQSKAPSFGVEAAWLVHVAPPSAEKSIDTFEIVPVEVQVIVLTLFAEEG